MSYSFNARGSKAEVVAKANEKLDTIAQEQSVHAADRDQAKAAVAAFVAILAEPTNDNEISLSVSGSLGWLGTPPDIKVTSANIGIQAYSVAKALSA